ncbi:MAG: class I SAM-dependent methyltransferase [Bacteroidia bacterium]|nr:class I SAM-dependent methyltransferase [Bacteroidia bacterium]
MKRIDHKEIYSDGKSYDALNVFDTDVPFYSKLIAKYGQPILELACGTGRITVPIAKKGFEIVGIDISEAMINEAKEKAAEAKQDIEFIEADIRDFELNQKFSVIFLPFNSICHLHDFESIASCFSCVKKHLKPDGRFVIDVFKPDFKILLRDKNKRYECADYKNPYADNHVKLTETNWYNEADQINQVKWYFEIGEKEIEQDLNMRMFYPQELDNYLRFAGFEIEEKFGDYNGSIFTSDSSKQIIISGMRNNK